jgi:hypothetical protein
LEDRDLYISKLNFIPRGLVPLERIFNSNGIPLKYSMKPQPLEVEDYNMGIEVDSELIKLSKTLSPKEKC